MSLSDYVRSLLIPLATQPTWEEMAARISRYSEGAEPGESVRLLRDARVQRIYAGTNEIMKLLIARSL